MSRSSRSSRHQSRHKRVRSRRDDDARRSNASGAPDDDTGLSDSRYHVESEPTAFDNERSEGNNDFQQNRSALYEDEPDESEVDFSPRFDDLMAGNAQSGDEETAIVVGEDSRADGNPHHEDSSSRDLGRTRPSDGEFSSPMDDDDDSIDDPFGHPLENPHFRARRPPATTPGAVAVVRRGYEESDLNNDDEWDPTAPSDLNIEEAPVQNEGQTRTYLDATVTIKKKMNEMSTRRMLVYVFITLFILGGAVAGIAIALTGNNNSSSAPASSSPTDPCDFSGTTQPDPILQCACDGNITLLADVTLAAYVELKESFIPDLFPDEFDYLDNSCEPQNVALLWLAADQDLQERSPESKRNRYLLSLLYVYWHGFKWKKNRGWLSSESECEWWGVNCTDSLVSNLTLSDNYVRGDIVSELGLFRDLRIFNLAINDLAGSLPTEIDGANSLELLALSRNMVTGTIPTTLGTLSNLKYLNMASNLMSGSIPTELIGLRNLEYLELNDNSLTGSIPASIGEMTTLKLFSTATNALGGPVPPTITLLTNLEGLWIAENDHSGTIPSGIFSLTTLKQLLLGFNRFDSGSSLPTEIGKLTSLEELICPNMQMTGTIPSEVGDLTNLVSLLLQSNALTGTIPSTLGRLVKAEKIVLHYNELVGSVPEQVCALTENVLKELIVVCGYATIPECDCCLWCFDV